jgi:hypothetical protein
MDIRQVTNTSMQDNVSMQFVDVNRAPYLIVLIKLRIVVDLYEKIPMTLEVQICSVLETNWFQCGSGFSFYLIADPDPWSQTNADPDLDPGQTFKSQKVELLHKNMLKVGKRSRNTVPTKIQNPFLMAGIQVYLCILVPDPFPVGILFQILDSQLMRIHAVPDPQHCKFGFKL